MSFVKKAEKQKPVSDKALGRPRTADRGNVFVRPTTPTNLDAVALKKWKKKQSQAYYRQKILCGSRADE